ncbi:MAG: aminotransferase class V-fold PLP-dependent enzyme [Rhodobacter sp.]|uniref:aminotransferase class V-fold PLP-dependent enzyme n=1 Tax=Pararhodobacter sp. TaxID=2127056 RepID=UPI001D93AD56|nr:aminotransferase class V-fold PLP-dependent enzyme [Pararhodobacter sp.]MCB1346648.1 aminotransferase class V-fold PLP-dependent enzyme [Paracoccaceae bacterium]MCC0074106.1 aminotransferase class V-fold PLP-dependent enzyme [Rhodobacter sp.]HPD92366.1 aminotransferase class V-fold PLP-dependent enzyme [Pararhodobacter sp.]
MVLDLDFTRAQFPAFAEPALQGQAFFENAGGSYTCKPVIDRLTRFYHQRKVQPYGPYEASRLGGEEMDEARARLAALMGVATDEVSFGPSTTANTYVLAQAFRQHLKPGDAIVVTNQDHEANTGPWRRLADSGIEVREWQIDPATGHLPLDRLGPLLKGAKLVCFPHCSNVVAEVNPVAEIAAMAHAEGAVVCVDGVSYAPHGFPDIAALGADIYLFSAYKTYGPHQGILVIRRALGMALPNQGHYFNGDDLFKRFTPAGPDHAQVAACAGMADYIDAQAAHHGGAGLDPKGRAALVHDLMRAHETALLQPLLDYLGGRNELRLLGPKQAARRAPTVAVMAERRGVDIARDLAGLGIMAGGGDFYAVRALAAQGANPDHGVLRMSFVHYTARAEVDQLIAALDRVL